MGATVPQNQLQTSAGASGMNDGFLFWMHQQERHPRLEDYKIYSSYYDGDHVVELPPKIQKSLEQELGVIANYCKPIVDLTVQYLLGSTVSIDTTQFGQNTELAQWGEQVLYSVYKRNRLLYGNMIKLLRSMGKKGDSFVKLYVENGEIRLSIPRAEYVFPKYRDDNYEDMEYCVIKYYSLDPTGNRVWRAQVFYPDRMEQYFLGVQNAELYTPSRLWRRLFKRDRYQNTPDTFNYYDEKETHFDKWEPEGVWENPLGVIPVVHFKNVIDDQPFGVSDLQVVTSLQDNLNKILTDMLVSVDNTAFPRLFLVGGMAGAGGKISVSPGTIADLPDGASVQVVPPSSIYNYVVGIQALVEQMSTVTQIPVEVFRGFNGLPVSGYALRILFMNLESKTKERMANVSDGLSLLNRMIFNAVSLMGLASWELLSQLETEIHFTSGIPIDKLADTQYYSALLSQGVVSLDWVRERVGVENLEEIKVQIQNDFWERYGMQIQLAEASAQEE